MKALADYQIGERIHHRAFGDGKIIEVHAKDGHLRWRVDFLKEGARILAITAEQLVTDEPHEDGEPMDTEAMKQAIREVLKEESVIGEVPMGDKWYGGKIVLHPGKPDMQPKEIPLNDFFHKIVMVRDRLRVLEQRINAHELLDEQEKVNLQQYITRSYGSLTTFNTLFAERDDWFIGSKGA
jgi:hypothetical protein